MVKLLSLYIPFLIIPFTVIYLQNKGFRLPSFQRINLGLVECCYFNTLLIVIFKTMNGRMRPNFYSLCGYEYNNSTYSYGVLGEIGSINKCRGDVYSKYITKMVVLYLFLIDI